MFRCKFQPNERQFRISDYAVLLSSSRAIQRYQDFDCSSKFHLCQNFIFEAEKDWPPRSTTIAGKMQVFGRSGSTFELSVGYIKGQLIQNPHAKCNRTVPKSLLQLLQLNRSKHPVFVCLDANFSPTKGSFEFLIMQFY